MNALCYQAWLRSSVWKHSLPAQIGLFAWLIRNTYCCASPQHVSERQECVKELSLHLVACHCVQFQSVHAIHSSHHPKTERQTKQSIPKSIAIVFHSVARAWKCPRHAFGESCPSASLPFGLELKQWRGESMISSIHGNLYKTRRIAGPLQTDVDDPQGLRASCTSWMPTVDW